MKYLFVIDYDHLDNGAFLKELAKILSSSKIPPSIIIHGDSAYTERIIQTGMMRDDAKIRAIKELNHRLVALFADEGVACVGLNGYQRKTIIRESEKESLIIDSDYLKRISEKTHVLISSLAESKNGTVDPVELPELALEIRKQLNISDIIVFSKSANSTILINDTNSENQLPEGLKSLVGKVKILGLSEMMTGKWI
jgi:hypothetical protein